MDGRIEFKIDQKNAKFIKSYKRQKIVVIHDRQQPQANRKKKNFLNFY